nr:unnamed protein product [Callosobruchus analis]
MGATEPVQLTLAGFFYLGPQDICKTFCCGIEVYGWKAEDCPITDHIKFSRSCVYAKHVKKLLERIIGAKDSTIKKNNGFIDKCINLLVLCFCSVKQNWILILLLLIVVINCIG